MNNISNKDTIIFDFDGVLYDSLSLVKEDMYMKYPNLKESDFLKIFENDFWDGVKRIKDLYGEPNHSNESTVKIKGNLFIGIPELINNLKNRYNLIINSSSKIDNILNPLTRSKIDDCFIAIYGKESGVNKIEKFKKIFYDKKIKPEKVVFITDSIGDIKDAAVLNIDTLAITWGIHKESDFKKLGLNNIIGIINTIPELEKILTKK